MDVLYKINSLLQSRNGIFNKQKNRKWNTQKKRLR